MQQSMTFDPLLAAIFLGFAVWAAVSDAKELRIPNAVSLGAALLYPAHVLASRAHVDWLGAVAIAAILLAAGIALFARGLVGGGDVKFLSAAALWAGPPFIFPFLALMGLAGVLLAVHAWAMLYVRRFRSAGIHGLATPDATGAGIAPVPYGIAIALGAAYVGLRLLLG